ncbi:MAG: hypothetical protein HY741_02990 [Chloroflexi bacterium]|nr:hypothetical protein [Chloroflexota bacterium]
MFVTLGYLGSHYASAQCNFQARSLTEATPQEIATAATQYTCTQFNAAGETRVRLSRRVNDSDLLELGLHPENICRDQPLYLVIVQGNFTSKLERRGKEIKYKYVSYVFDLTTGNPISWATSQNGGAFRKILDDATLPDDPVMVPPELLTPDARIEQSLAKTREAESNHIQRPVCGSNLPAPTRAP